MRTSSLHELLVCSPVRDSLESRTSCVGQRVVEVASGVGISAGELSMPEVGHLASVHVHWDTDIVVRILHGNAVTLAWDHRVARFDPHVECFCLAQRLQSVSNTCRADVHGIWQTAGETLLIPAGVIHAGVNVGPLPVIAFETRANGSFSSDSETLPDLTANAGLFRDYLIGMDW